MFCRFDRLTIGSSLLLLLVAIGTSRVAGDNAKIIPVQTTATPPPATQHGPPKAPPVAGTGKPDVLPASPKHVDAPKIVTNGRALAVQGPVSTIKPADSHMKPTTSAPVAPAAPHTSPTHAGSAAPIDNADANQGPGKKLAQYFEPICNHIDKLTNEHMFKIQGQMKQIIEKTAGKMSVCFMQHYMMDPNLTPVTRDQLKTICSSQTLAADHKNSFKSFQTCSANNWDKNLDTELDRIIKLRLNCFFNHAHSKQDATVSLVHESDELSIIGEVVGKVLSDNKLAGNNNSNITLINVGLAPAAAANPVAAKPAAPANAAAADGKAGPNDQAATGKKILNDPNTVLVIVNDSSTSGAAPNKTNAPHPPPPAPPAKVHVPPSPSTPPPSSKAPAVSTHKPNPPGPTTAAKPTGTALGEKIIAAATTGAPKPPATTAIPKANASLTTPQTNEKVAAGLAMSTTKPTAASTGKPAASTPKSANTTLKPAANSTTGHPASTAAPGTSKKPQTTPATGSTPAPEKDKKEADDAIKSLQVQRAGHVSDARLHQLEHERQMAIDPEGHTDKHKKYEQMKQQRTSKAPSTTTTPTTKKA